ncbi:hypothetical protein EPN83_01610 [Patescibacteria group bacterium]|nr:MAG: hypothetical protein EPN83_01610 [Patescibacteria group bacterium]
MLVSYKWLQGYFDEPLPPAEKLVELLTRYAFEVESVEKRGEDSVLYVKVLPDRAHDCLSHIGIAKEISTISRLPLKTGLVSARQLSAPESNLLKAESEDPALCPRFSALVIENVEVKESPGWLKDLLAAIGQKSVNNIVDVTNYCMFAYNQPLHAYDLGKLSSGEEGYKLTARTAGKKMKFLALDDKEHNLVETDLIIADGVSGETLGIAGIKGGKAFQIEENTKRIALEAANFNPVSISKTSRRLSLLTDASRRFENGISPSLTLIGLSEASRLILEIAGGEKIRVEGLCDFYPRRANPYKLGVSLSEVRNWLGLDITSAEIEEILNRRGFEWGLVSPREEIVARAKELIGVPYKYGSSVLYDAPKTFDCSSFTAYLCAQAGASIPRMTIDQYVWMESVEDGEAQPGDFVFSNTHDLKRVIRTESVEFMAGTKVPDGVDHVGVLLGEGKVVHATETAGKVIKEELAGAPRFQDLRGFRRAVSDGKRYVVTVPDERLDLRIKEDLIEEIGRLYGYDRIGSRTISGFPQEPEINKTAYYCDRIRDLLRAKGCSEVITYALRSDGEVELENPTASDKRFLRRNLSDALSESLEINVRNADLLGLDEIKIFEIGNVFPKEGERLSIALGVKNGRGSAKKETEEVKEIVSMLSAELGVEFPPPNGAVYEVNLGKILDGLPAPEKPLSYEKPLSFSYKKFSPYPFVVRDIAVLSSEEPKKVEEFVVNGAREAIKGSKIDLVNSRIFDVFEPKEGGKSTAVRLVFQSSERTLTDSEVNEIMKKVTEDVSEKGWQVR